MKLPLGRTLHWQLGQLSLWLERSAEEILLAFDRNDKEEDRLVVARLEAKPQDLEWQRFAVGEGLDRITFRPLLSERPMIVRPESAITVPPGMSSDYYARVPLWIGLEMARPGDDPVALVEIPTVVLSNTWFGEDTMSGRLCYAMRTTARRTLQDVAARHHRAICPFQVRNVSKEPLVCERFSMDVQHLALHELDNLLWTPTVVITHRGSEAGQEVEFSQQTPDKRPLGPVISPAREPIGGSFLRQSISSFNLASLFR